MKDIKINKEKLELMMLSLSNWDEWAKIEDEIFKVDEWPSKDANELDDLYDRPPIVIDGRTWETIVSRYDIPPELLFLHEKLSYKAFEILEPEADKGNQEHPENYGKWCIYCSIWTKEYPHEVCPKCGKELLPLPLND